MARTVFSVSQRQTPGGKTNSAKGNVVASLASLAARTSSSSSRSLPPKKLARTAKKVAEIEPEKKTRKKPGSSVDDKAGAVKRAAGEGLKGKYINMIAECIFQLKQKKGSSRVVITNQLKLQFANVIGYKESDINLNIKLALKKGLDEGVFKMANETGKGSGSYKLTETEIKKLKKKLTKQQTAAKMKQQTSLRHFITTTPLSFNVKENQETPQSVKNPRLKMKSVESSVLKTPISDTPDMTAGKNSSVKKRVMTSGTEDNREESVNEASGSRTFAKENITTPESFVLLKNIMDSVKRSPSSAPSDSSSSPSLRKKVKRGQ